MAENGLRAAESASLPQTPREGSLGSREEKTLGYCRKRRGEERQGNVTKKDIPYSL